MPIPSELENARRLKAVGFTDVQAETVVEAIAGAKARRRTNGRKLLAVGFTNAQAETLAHTINEFVSRQY
jgi:hypothetical protein